MRMNSPRYNGYEQGPDFDRARSQIATPFQYVDIDLSIAATNEVFDVSGDFLYLDPAGTGSATLELNNQYNTPAAPFLVDAGWAINAIFKRVKLSWQAQPGKFLRLMYSTGEKVVPTNSTTVNGTVKTISEGETVDWTSLSNTAMGAASSLQLLSPAANLTGVRVLKIRGIHRTAIANDPFIGFFTGTAAPASAADPGCFESLGRMDYDATNWKVTFELPRPVDIAPGNGVWVFCQSAEVAGLGANIRSVFFKNL